MANEWLLSSLLWKSIQAGIYSSIHLKVENDLIQLIVRIENNAQRIRFMIDKVGFCHHVLIIIISKSEKKKPNELIAERISDRSTRPILTVVGVND